MSSFSRVLAFCAMLPAVMSLANVTVTEAPGGCSAYPTYDSSTGATDRFLIHISGSSSSAEGFGDVSQVVRRAGDTGIHMGRITFPDNNQLAKTTIRCSDSAGLQAYTESGVSGVAWNDLNLAPYPYDAEIMWGVSGPAIQAYYHDGSSDTLFLGSGNVTKWGIQPIPASESEDGRAYWNLRLLGPDSAIPGTNGTALYPGEVETFITVISAV